MLYKKAICVGTGLVLVLSSADIVKGGDCPDIPIKELATAACSKESNPYSSGSLSKVKFYATTPCPSGIGISKTLQAAFKGGKDYTGTLKGSVPGEVACTYKLDKPWQEALNTDHTDLILTASLPTRDHVNYLGAPLVGVKCPDLTKSDVDSIKSGKIEVQKTRDPQLTYLFKVGKLTGASVMGGLKGIFGKAPDLSKISGTMNVTKDYEITCGYTHHTGGKETPLELKGSSRLSK